MFDTDTVSYFIRDNPKSVRAKTIQNTKSEFCISAITCAELLYGLKKNYSKQLDFWIHELLRLFQVIVFDEKTADIYGDIRTSLEKSGEPLDNMDMLIAASAFSAGAILVSHNKKHFSRIKGLKVEDWTYS